MAQSVRTRAPRLSQGLQQTRCIANSAHRLCTVQEIEGRVEKKLGGRWRRRQSARTSGWGQSSSPGSSRA